jgi:hypothetical protein
LVLLQQLQLQPLARLVLVLVPVLHLLLLVLGVVVALQAPVAHCWWTLQL